MSDFPCCDRREHDAPLTAAEDLLAERQAPTPTDDERPEPCSEECGWCGENMPAPAPSGMTDAEWRTRVHAAIRRGIESVVPGSASREVVRAAADQVLAAFPVVGQAPTPPTREALAEAASAHVYDGSMGGIGSEAFEDICYSIADDVLALVSPAARDTEPGA